MDDPVDCYIIRGCIVDIMVLKSNSMGLFEKELEGLEGTERRKAYKRLHTARKRAESKKADCRHCKVKVRLEPTQNQADFLRYLVDCSSQLYEFMVNVWKNCGSPPNSKKDFWKQYKAEFNSIKKQPEFELFAKCPSHVLAWVFNELRFSQTRKGGLEGNMMRDWFGLEWSKCHLLVKQIKLVGMNSLGWIKIADSPIIPNGLIKSAKVSFEDGSWYIIFSIDPRRETKEQKEKAYAQKKRASKAWFHSFTNGI
jgi:hypothetical protein